MRPRVCFIAYQLCRILGIASLLASSVSRGVSANLLPDNGTFSASQSCQAASLNGYSEPQDYLPCGWELDGPAAVSGVNVVGPSVYDVADPLGAAQYLAFTGGDGGQDCLLAEIPTVAGDSYLVSFWVAIVGPQPNYTAALTFEWDTNSPNGYCQGSPAGTPCSGPGDQLLYNSYFYWNIAPNYPNTTDEPFKEFTFTVKADITGMTGVYFHGEDYDPSSTTSALLVADASVVQVSATPEPGSLWMTCVGFAILGLMLVKLDRQRRLHRD